VWEGDVRINHISVDTGTVTQSRHAATSTIKAMPRSLLLLARSDLRLSNTAHFGLAALDLLLGLAGAGLLDGDVEGVLVLHTRD
jgi:hypothetical protein